MQQQRAAKDWFRSHADTPRSWTRIASAIKPVGRRIQGDVRSGAAVPPGISDFFSSKISFPRSEALFSPCKRVYFIQLDLLTAGEVLLICWCLRLSCTRWTDEKASRQSESKARRCHLEAFGCPWRPYPTQTHTAGASDLCCRCLNEWD